MTGDEAAYERVPGGHAGCWRRRTRTPPRSCSSAPATSSPTRARSARRSPAPTSAAAGSPPPRREFERAVELDPVNDYAHFGLGLCLLRVGDRLGARRHLKLAVAMRPDSDEYRRRARSRSTSPTDVAS